MLPESTTRPSRTQYLSSWLACLVCASCIWMLSLTSTMHSTILLNMVRDHFFPGFLVMQMNCEPKCFRIHTLFLDASSSLNTCTIESLFLCNEFVPTAGFTQTRRACCGEGLISTAEFCNPDSLGTCSDASEYLFFDSLHPSQTAYKQIAEAFYNDIVSFLAN